ncbi:MAG TPA: hypothetical protein VFS08_02130 [Gemmatimonadaceae bacterium]|nr:hypothetical protein [Gemmatimonadaceae bacterium]
MSTPAPAALQALLHDLVDYAGLFPPAALDMETAVRHYARYHASADHWMLGRFVVPAARLDEFAEAASHHRRHGGAPWRLSALVGPDTAADLARVAQFNDAAGPRGATVDVIEARAPGTAAIAALAAARPHGLAAYVEIPASADPAPLASSLRAVRLRAKLRTGGVTPDAFPDPEEVVRFLRACAEAGVECKLTAGLHHAVTGDYRLTYAADSGRAPMFGFVNVVLAALLLRDGLDDAEAERLLLERDPGTFTFDDEAARWREHAVPTARVAAGRARYLLGFGSCSFEEPVGEVRALGWME